jgi:ubiquinone/menaquinone biosynthesis C-methylase UbiE
MSSERNVGWIEDIGKWTAIAAGALSIGFGLAHIFGWFELKWFQERQTLFLVVCSGLVLELLAILAWITGREFEALKTQLQSSPDVELKRLRDAVDPHFEDLVGGEVQDLFDRTSKLVNKKTLHLSNPETFWGFYRKTLEKYPRKEFWATSMVSFWRGTRVAPAIAAFTNKGRGGKMIRIFFIDSEADLKQPETRRVLKWQQDMEVDVRTALRNELPEDLRLRFFFVDKEGDVAWETFPRDGIVNEVTLVAGEENTREYRRDFMRLQQLPCVKPYHDPNPYFDPQGEGPSSPNPEKFRTFEREQWEICTPQYDKYFGPLTRQVNQRLLNEAEVSAGDRVLDLACGPGSLAADAEARGATVVGLDFSVHMIESARRKHPKLECVCAYAEELPFKNESFDVVLLNFGIFHLARPEDALREVFRVLRKGGRVAMTAWAEPGKACAFEAILKPMFMHTQNSQLLPIGPQFFRFSDEAESERVLAEAGFEVNVSTAINLEWHLDSGSDFFRAFRTGTARIGGILRGQTPEDRQAIEKLVLKNVAEFADHGGKLHIPTTVLLFCGVKPG